MKYLTLEKALEAWQQLQPLTEDAESDERLWWYDGECGTAEDSPTHFFFVP